MSSSDQPNPAYVALSHLMHSRVRMNQPREELPAAPAKVRKPRVFTRYEQYRDQLIAEVIGPDIKPSDPKALARLERLLMSHARGEIALAMFSDQKLESAARQQHSQYEDSGFDDIPSSPTPLDEMQLAQVKNSGYQNLIRAECKKIATELLDPSGADTPAQKHKRQSYIRVLASHLFEINPASKEFIAYKKAFEALVDELKNPSMQTQNYLEANPSDNPVSHYKAIISQPLTNRHTVSLAPEARPWVATLFRADSSLEAPQIKRSR